MNYVEYHSKDQIGYITMNRPEKRNALSEEMVEQLRNAFTKAETDPSVKIVILKGNGEAFCSGADLKSLQDMQAFSYDQNHEDSTNLKELFLQIYTLKKVVIASIHGHAVAGGCGLASICDFSFALPNVKFGFPEVKRGFVPAIVMVFLIRKIGEGKARKILLDGGMFSAKEALEMGLINGVFVEDELDEKVGFFAQKLMDENSASSMRVTKEMIATVQSLTLDSALSYAALMNAKARSSDDCKKGIAAFLNKERVVW
jgi:methylglutaconyl-CoA hydratase